jgi:ribosomal protein S18 acetylase RimI-like enzyme
LASAAKQDDAHGRENREAQAERHEDSARTERRVHFAAPQNTTGWMSVTPVDFLSSKSGSSLVTVVDFSLEPVRPEDADWVKAFVSERWGTPLIAVRGKLVDTTSLPGFIAADVAGARVGLVTYRYDPQGAVEIITLDSLRPSTGIGSALVERVLESGRARGAERAWIITTNDNLLALRFWQRRGFSISAVHRDAVTRARAAKPSIPHVGEHGIPIRDEVELEIALSPSPLGAGAGLRVRRAAPLDRDAIVAIDHLALSEPERERYIDRVVQSGTCLVVERDGAILAYGALEQSFLEQPFISMVYVAQGSRRHGVGRILLRALIDRSGEPRIFTTTKESNQPMQRLLESEGFRPSGIVHGLAVGDPELVFVLSRDGVQRAD